MQNALLDIVIIGVLVLLFASTYRKRGTPMVRSWTIGWVLILLHFATLLFHPVSPARQAAQQVISVTALIACGLVFLLAAVNKDASAKPNRLLSLFAGGASVAFLALDTYGVTASLPYVLLAAVGAACWLVYIFVLKSLSPAVRLLLLMDVIFSTCWLAWTVWNHAEDIGISAILCELYLAVAFVYMGSFRRLSGGTLTVVLGLMAWAAVFPAGEFCDHLHIAQAISPEFWNLPKYFVAFGMMLVMLEEEIVAANAASKQYRVLFEANPHPMWIYDQRTLAFQGVNDAALQQYGYSREQFLNMTLAEVSGPDGDSDSRDDAGDREGDIPAGCIQQHRKSDGSLCFVDVATHPLRSDGRSLAFSLVQDVTERQQLHQRLSYQAHHDLLTGLANRAWMEAKLRDTLAHSSRYGRKSALICLDIDRFKQINDTYGHGVGDICLQEVARRLGARVRSMDVAARIGGEEFSLLLHEIAGGHEAEQVAAAILEALREPIEANEYSLELTGSVGIAIYPQDGMDGATLWRNADSAMYRAKRAGGNQYLCMSPEIGLINAEANEMEHCLRLALKGEGLEMHYQPLYTIEGQLHSLEALVRFRHPESGLILPLRFVPIAEESGLIVPLGMWVLNEVCRQLAAWQRRDLPPVRVALNISPLQVTRPDFGVQVTEVLARHTVDPHLLGMEITETAMMRNIGEATRQIKLLADQGVYFSVDDFGTGYSSLGQLDKLSVHELKIDRTFVERICRPDGTYSIVDAMISMAHSLRLKVVAEGVETLEQWNCLRDLKCDMVQGFYFSKAVPADEVPILLMRREGPGRAVAGDERKALVA